MRKTIGRSLIHDERVPVPVRPDTDIEARSLRDDLLEP